MRGAEVAADEEREEEPVVGENMEGEDEDEDHPEEEESV